MANEGSRTSIIPLAVAYCGTAHQVLSMTCFGVVWCLVRSVPRWPHLLCRQAVQRTLPDSEAAISQPCSCKQLRAAPLPMSHGSNRDACCGGHAAPHLHQSTGTSLVSPAGGLPAAPHAGAAAAGVCRATAPCCRSGAGPRAGESYGGRRRSRRQRAGRQRQ